MRRDPLLYWPVQSSSPNPSCACKSRLPSKRSLGYLGLGSFIRISPFRESIRSRRRSSRKRGDQREISARSLQKSMAFWGEGKLLRQVASRMPTTRKRKADHDIECLSLSDRQASDFLELNS
ncbi:hypothetical protein Q3G72_028478 [Acer saccharum]|nr:hypothetical protein Q3G72_028478 [Acer saccharum]